MTVSKATIKRWNDKFKALSKAEKRIEIAKDVIRQIGNGRYTAATTYFTEKSDLNFEDDVQKHFDELKCQVCGVGACLLSIIKYENDAMIGDLYSSGSVYKKLGKYFSARQLHYIECVYEICHGSRAESDYMFVPSDDDRRLLRESFDLYRRLSPKNRMLSIMKNIIRNDGIFKPLDFKE